MRFSVQYCVAALLRIGGVRLAAFTAANRANPALRALMERVSVSLAPDLADAYPRRRPARVTVTLRDGRVLERYQPTRKGDPDDPLSDAELSAKFLELAGPAMAGDPARLLDALWTGTDVPGSIPLRVTGAGASDGPRLIERVAKAHAWER